MGGVWWVGVDERRGHRLEWISYRKWWGWEEESVRIGGRGWGGGRGGVIVRAGAETGLCLRHRAREGCRVSGGPAARVGKTPKPNGYTGF